MIGGRYGLGSKDVAPNQIKKRSMIICYCHLKELKQRFTVGIVDDVTYQSLPEEPTFRFNARYYLPSKILGLWF